MGRILAVADVHGQGALLGALLHYADYSADRDRLYLLGDYVSKGPDSGGTLRLVHHLCESGAVALRGNHDCKWLRDSEGKGKPANEWTLFLQGLPFWAEADHYLFVHAGIRPGVPLVAQTEQDLTEIRDEFLHLPTDYPKTIVFGHTPTHTLGAEPGTVWRGPGKLGIDTGAGHGITLSLVDLTGWICFSAPIDAGLRFRTVSLP